MGYKYRDLLMWWAGTDALTLVPVTLGHQDASTPVKVKLYTKESRAIRDLMLCNARAYREALMRKYRPHTALQPCQENSRILIDF